MEDGGGDAMTPQMVLAAARPPLEALGARDGRAAMGNKGNMGLDEDWGEDLAVEQEPRRDRLSRPGGAETSDAAASGAPCGEGGMRLGTSGLSPPGVPGGSIPTLISHSARYVTANRLYLSSTSKMHTRTPPHTASQHSRIPQSDQLKVQCEQRGEQGGQEDVARTQVTTEVQRGLQQQLQQLQQQWQQLQQQLQEQQQQREPMVAAAASAASNQDMKEVSALKGAPDAAAGARSDGCPGTTSWATRGRQGEGECALGTARTPIVDSAATAAHQEGKGDAATEAARPNSAAAAAHQEGKGDAATEAARPNSAAGPARQGDSAATAAALHSGAATAAARLSGTAGAAHQGVKEWWNERYYDPYYDEADLRASECDGGDEPAEDDEADPRASGDDGGDEPAEDDEADLRASEYDGGDEPAEDDEADPRVSNIYDYEEDEAELHAFEPQPEGDDEQGYHLFLHNSDDPDPGPID
eukprot:SAG11_NODE_464_length_9216_cov_131.568326_3_plen_471_part_00